MASLNYKVKLGIYFTVFIFSLLFLDAGALDFNLETLDFKAQEIEEAFKDDFFLVTLFVKLVQKVLTTITGIGCFTCIIRKTQTRNRL